MANSERIIPPDRSVLFRADGNAQIGMGHIMRCLALAEMLGPTYRRRFAIVQPPLEVVKLLEEKGIETVWLENSEDFLSLVKPDVVVVLDGYSFDSTFQRIVRKRSKALVFIDDLVTGHQVADVVVNHAGGLTPNDYQAEPYTQLLLGPHYALLRPPFFKPSSPVPTEGSLFVSLGGADPSNTTIRVLEALLICFQLLKQEWRVHVVIGPLQANRLAIESFQSRFKHIHIIANLTAEQMVAELMKCQLAITACSTVAYEVCSIGRPLIAIQTASNQGRLATFLTEKALAEVMPAGASIHDIAREFDQSLRVDMRGFWQNVIKNQHRFFDSRSPERFQTFFARLCS